MYEEEKSHDPEAPQLDCSLRALSSRWSDEGSQEGSEQEGMPWKGARMKIGDLVNFTLPENRRTVVLLVGVRTVVDGPQRIWSIVEGGEIYEVRESWLKERANESR